MVNLCPLAQQGTILLHILHATAIDLRVTKIDLATGRRIKVVKVRVRQETVTGRRAMETGHHIKAVRAAHVRQETVTGLRIRVARVAHAQEVLQAAGRHIKVVHAQAGRQETAAGPRIRVVVRAVHAQVAHQVAVVLPLVLVAPVAHQAAHVEKMIKNLKLPAQETINAIFGAVSSIFKRQAIKKIKKTLLAKKTAKL